MRPMPNQTPLPFPGKPGTDPSGSRETDAATAPADPAAPLDPGAPADPAGMTLADAMQPPAADAPDTADADDTHAIPPFEPGTTLGDAPRQAELPIEAGTPPPPHPASH